LTFLLRDSIGGTSRMVLIVNVSPSRDNANETLSSLRFGLTAKAVKNRVPRTIVSLVNLPPPAPIVLAAAAAAVSAAAAGGAAAGAGGEGEGFPALPFTGMAVVTAGDTVRFDRTGPEAAADEAYVSTCAATIEDLIRAAVSRMAAEKRAERRPEKRADRVAASRKPS
jgi:hypothetical protein